MWLRALESQRFLMFSQGFNSDIKSNEIFAIENKHTKIEKRRDNLI